MRFPPLCHKISLSFLVLIMFEVIPIDLYIIEGYKV